MIIRLLWRYAESGALQPGEIPKGTSEPLPVPKGAQKELERDFGQGYGVTGQGFSQKKGRFTLDKSKKFFPVKVLIH